MAQFETELHSLAADCNEMLGDCIVCGIQDEAIQRKLLAEPNLTLTKALTTARGMEAAAKDTEGLHTESTTAHTYSMKSKHKAASDVTDACYRCGKKGHKAEICKFEDEIFHNCGKKGHIRPVCRGERKGKPQNPPRKPQRKQCDMRWLPMETSTKGDKYLPNTA